MAFGKGAPDYSARWRGHVPKTAGFSGCCGGWLENPAEVQWL